MHHPMNKLLILVEVCYLLLQTSGQKNVQKNDKNKKIVEFFKVNINLFKMYEVTLIPNNIKSRSK